MKLDGERRMMDKLCRPAAAAAAAVASSDVIVAAQSHWCQSPVV